MHQLYAVSAVSSDDVWAVGEYHPTGLQRPLAIHWNGASWNMVYVPPIVGDYSELLDVSARTSDDVWAVGYRVGGTSNGTVIIHWDGTQWSEVPINDPDFEGAMLTGVAARAANDVWAVGYRGASGQRSSTITIHWNGYTWHEIPSPNPGPLVSQLYDVSIVSSDDVWAVGFHKVNDSHQTLTIHWDGSRWEVIPSPNPEIHHNLDKVVAVAPNDVWASGYKLTGRYTTFVVHWDGKSWTHIPTPNVGDQESITESITALPDGTVWAAGHYNDLPSSYILLMRYMTACGTATATPGLTSPTPTSSVQPSPTACPINFTDVPPGNVFNPYVRCLACRDIIAGYPCGRPSEPCEPQTYPYFRPNSEITRGQLAKIISISAGFNEDPGPRMFFDVPPGDTFYPWINRLARRGHMTGYPCGIGYEYEICHPGNLPYFRPRAFATRGQIAKITASAAGINDPPGDQIFADVPPDHTFYMWIQRLAHRGIISGYPCGGPGEPCDSSHRSYFRPGNNSTRGQVSKITASVFFPGCTPLAMK
jgi:hypothetical protein